MRVVIDANVIAAALLRRDGTPRRAVDYVFERGLPLWSVPIFDEINDVLNRPYFRARLEPAEREAMLLAIVALGERVDPPGQLQVGRDPKDDKYLDVALAGSAAAIVSGDKDLLVLDPFRGVRVLSPSAFLEFVSSSPNA